MAFNLSCGASASQDARFGDKMKKLLKTTKFPPEFDKRIDMKRVKLEVMLPWITQQVEKYLGFEDEVVIGYVESQLQPTEGGRVDPKQMQLYLTGFLEHNTSKFMQELWSLLSSAQENELGVPTEFLERKKEEIRQKKEEQDRVAAALKAKREEVERQLEGMEVGVALGPGEGAGVGGVGALVGARVGDEVGLGVGSWHQASAP